MTASEAGRPGSGKAVAGRAATGAQRHSQAVLTQLAMRLAAGGRSSATTQQQVLSDLLDSGGRVTPRRAFEMLAARVGVVGDPAVGSTARSSAATAVAQISSRLAALDAAVTVVGSPDYPASLADAWPELGAPLWLFVAGARPPVARRAAVAVVGTRTPTADGRRTAHALGGALAEAGALVVSGLARGIDQAAHRGALDAGGDTVAVLGTGLGVDYPSGTQGLRGRIVASGALVTELPPGAPPRPWQFLERNRIISGLADATVVVEGRARSGALQTARLAASQGRDVWAVPGSINSPASAAPLALLRDGALPLTNIDAFVAGVAGDRPSRPEATAALDAASGPMVASTRDPARSASDVMQQQAFDGVSSDAAQVYCLLGAVPASTDDLVAAGTLPAHRVLVAVGELVDRGTAAVTPRGVIRA